MPTRIVSQSGLRPSPRAAKPKSVAGGDDEPDARHTAGRSWQPPHQRSTTRRATFIGSRSGKQLRSAMSTVAHTEYGKPACDQIGENFGPELGIGLRANRIGRPVPGDQRGKHEQARGNRQTAQIACLAHPEGRRGRLAPASLVCVVPHSLGDAQFGQDRSGRFDLACQILGELGAIEIGVHPAAWSPVRRSRCPIPPSCGWSSISSSVCSSVMPGAPAIMRQFCTSTSKPCSTKVGASV